TVQELLGHSTPMLTKRHYAHIVQDHKKKAIDLLCDDPENRDDLQRSKDQRDEEGKVEADKS
ncbi:MAG: hypothetical protein ABIH23_26330, partial [bacterium]